MESDRAESTITETKIGRKHNSASIFGFNQISIALRVLQASPQKKDQTLGPTLDQQSIYINNHRFEGPKSHSQGHLRHASEEKMNVFSLRQ